MEEFGDGLPLCGFRAVCGLLPVALGQRYLWEPGGYPCTGSYFVRVPIWDKREPAMGGRFGHAEDMGVPWSELPHSADKD